MPGRICSCCYRLFSSSSNRLRHERLFHRIKESEKQSNADSESGMDSDGGKERQTGFGIADSERESHEDSDDRESPIDCRKIRTDSGSDEENDSVDTADHDSSDSEVSSESSSDGEDDGRWSEIIMYAGKQFEDSSDSVFEEPYFSRFIEHMKIYVETRYQFVHDMNFNKDYEKIDKLITKKMRKCYGRQEASDSAWYDRRFLIKKIMLSYKDGSKTGSDTE